MNYLLYNPKANNSRNNINIIDKTTGEKKIEKVSLLTIDIPTFLNNLTADDKVYLCGGDGTLNKFANNTYGFEFPCPVYLVGGGTGNDFLNDIEVPVGQPVDIREYLKDLPVLLVGGREIRFLNGVGLGIDGAVCEEAERIKEKSDKKINYTAVAIGQFLGKYKRPAAKVTIDGETKEYKKVWMASAMKGRYFGGGMKVAPTQDRKSGKLLGCIFFGQSRPKTMMVFTKVYDGKHITHTEMLDFIEADEITVEFDIPTALQLDGEVISGVLSYTARTAKKHEEYLKAQAEN